MSNPKHHCSCECGCPVCLFRPLVWVGIVGASAAIWTAIYSLVS